MQTPMGPPPPKPLTDNTPEPQPQPDSNISETTEEPVENFPETEHDSAKTTSEPSSSHQSANSVVPPYTIPPWNGVPCHQFYLEVLMDGSIIDQSNVHEKGAYMFERVDLGDFVNGPMLKEGTTDTTVESSKNPEAAKIVSETIEDKTAVYTVVKPQWLGAIEDRKIKKTQQVASLDLHEPDHFVDYKDRNKILGSEDETQTKVGSGIESAAPGLIIRKRKLVEKPEGGDNNAPQLWTSSSSGAVMAEDAVALLLKHKKGHFVPDDEERYESQDISGGNHSSKDNKKPKRVLGPEKPSFFNSNSDYESWVPLEGQTGDGQRISLNERYGY